MFFLTLIAGAVTIFMIVVAPIWIGAHYLTRWRMAKSMSPADEERLADLWNLAERLEMRLDVIERILDADDDGLDKAHHGHDRFARDQDLSPERNS